MPKQVGLKTVQSHGLGSAEELVHRVASRLVELAAARRAGALAVSGGRIAPALFRAIVEECGRRAYAWPGWHCFWADERCVPPEHSQSNYRVARENLLEPLGWPDSRVHRLRGELEPRRAAEAGEAELRSVLGRSAKLDVVLLGMGEDGHVASLFPGRPEADDEEEREYLAVSASKPPTHRVTLTFSAIIRASQVWVVVSGHDKREVLERGLAGNKTLPIGRILAARSHTEVFYYVGFT
jgi:6-phosphogluconolactonase